ncbi:2,5-diamino-6-(ribosylamino)-4(3H)-pyrimidinone 5'-phosphate reductase [Actinomortierella ambigua]|nr:2,5-diamino-6-(ribosylamino)-4(3H)-pyrimidinone 5'-phosphate reductase [Actinomortierella ambigua]
MLYNFLHEIVVDPGQNTTKPFVTLTYAQSLDGKIAGHGGQQLILSGPESMKATHMLRAMHDGILVGINTVFNDDPRLTARISNDELPPRCISETGQPRNPALFPELQPKPIILDAQLRFPLSSKLLDQDAPTRPLILTRHDHSPERRRQLELRGATVVGCSTDSQGRLDLYNVVQELSARKIRSLMVEGGAGVIKSFLESGLVDLTIVTIAPTFVGQDGVSVIGSAQGLPQLENPTYHTLGRDVVLVAKVHRTASPKQ